ncbi:PREDICTED: uncharacterized protein LOC105970652 [Erythranthe guttata]|uniref:uncharacterized protein LOC105970652 n=1 Tax=Erythranthe guttata TaxID=4155 RepID=UPI00064DAE2C|nr:PREDICTED: uncharacterized protein LOC105970652 [Erythranthe guttata]|eukprot:XP_012850940.1 PREDICTED: uncharacterized protein LOC105970652 [Erythranthe guttata]
MADREEQHHQHIVMLPFMAQGHLIPFLALANQIHRRFGFTITIATTPLNVHHLAAVVAKNPTPSSGIHLFELPLNTSDHGLPPNAENTESLLPRTTVPCPNSEHHRRSKRPPSPLHNLRRLHGLGQRRRRILRHRQRDLHHRRRVRHRRIRIPMAAPPPPPPYSRSL